MSKVENHWLMGSSPGLLEAHVHDRKEVGGWRSAGMDGLTVSHTPGRQELLPSRFHPVSTSNTLLLLSEYKWKVVLGSEIE